MCADGSGLFRLIQIITSSQVDADFRDCRRGWLGGPVAGGHLGAARATEFTGRREDRLGCGGEGCRFRPSCWRQSLCERLTVRAKWGLRANGRTNFSGPLRTNRSSEREDTNKRNSLRLPFGHFSAQFEQPTDHFGYNHHHDQQQNSPKLRVQLLTDSRFAHY